MSRLALSVALVLAAAGCVPGPAQTRTEGEVGLNETVVVDGPRVTPLKVLEDSRCPKDVDCVWPGRVRLSVKVDGGGRSQIMTLESGHPAPVFDGKLTLTSVMPIRPKTRDIAPGDYRFRFRFDGGL